MKNYFKLSLMILLAFAFSSCSLLTQSTSASLIINLPQNSSRAAAPVNLSYYVINAVCADEDYNETYSTKDNYKDSVEFADLTEGYYTVSVKAYDKDDSLLAETTQTVKVSSGKKTNVTIKLNMNKVVVTVDNANDIPVTMTQNLNELTFTFDTQENASASKIFVNEDLYSGDSMLNISGNTVTINILNAVKTGKSCEIIVIVNDVSYVFTVNTIELSE